MGYSVCVWGVCDTLPVWDGILSVKNMPQFTPNLTVSGDTSLQPHRKEIVLSVWFYWYVDMGIQKPTME